ncbi:MAG: M23 family metallopeptidase [Eubacteriales bacterium]
MNKYKKKRLRKHYRYNDSKVLHIIIRIFCLALIIILLTNHLLYYNRPDYLNEFSYDLERIARFQINHEVLLSIKNFTDDDKEDFYKTLTNCMIEYNFELLNWDDNIVKDIPKIKENKEYKALKTIYEITLDDIKYFPIPENRNEENHGYNYVDSWEAERSYGGERKHYGTDVMDETNTRGYFPIVSVTSGKIEKIGWLEKGGYRIGIRSPSGAYFYYAHLYCFADGLEEGDEIYAGQIIGFMGDSGYGKEEGTIGKFPVHLHFGISLPLHNKNDEFWINPYWILRYLEKNKIKAWY